MTRRLSLGWWILACSFFFFWAFSGAGPITDPVESNYALPAKEMLLSGDWLTPHIYGKIWFDKPILIYWVTALSFKLFGISDSVARIAPALAGAGGLALIYSFTARMLTRRHGLIAAVVLGSSIHYFYMAKALVTDMFLFIAGSAGLAYFYMGYSRYKGTNNWYRWMYPCFAIAVLAKGPVGFLIPGLVIFLFLLFEKNGRELLQMKLLIGVPLFLLIAAPWFIYMYFLHGEEFVLILLGVHNVLRATVPEHPENNVFYYYPAIFTIGFLPWIGFVFHGIWKGIRESWHGNGVLQKFLLLWIFSYVAFYSLMATKYPTYLFPIWFPCAVLAAIYMPWNPKRFRFAEYTLPVTIWWLALTGASWYFLAAPDRWIYSGILLIIGIAHFYLIRIRPKGWYFSGMVFFTTFVYLIVAATALPAATFSRSGIDLPQKLSQYEGDHIGFYQTYSTGSVYYGGPIVTKVVLPKDMPHSGEGAHWNLKYQMPLETIQQFAASQDGKKRNILFLQKSKAKIFNETEGLSVESRVLEEHGKFLILEILPKKSGGTP